MSKKIFNCVVCCALSLFVISSVYVRLGNTTAVASVSNPNLPQENLISDSSFTSHTRLGEIQQLIEKRNPSISEIKLHVQGVMMPLAEYIEHFSVYSGIDPKILVVLWDMESSILSDPQNSSITNPDLLAIYFTKTSGDLNKFFMTAYYQDDYKLTTTDNQSYELNRLNAASVALYKMYSERLASDEINQGELHAFTASFNATYENLWGTVPSKFDMAARAPASQPEMGLPWTVGDTWYYTGGPHPNENVSSLPRYFVDFAPGGFSGCVDSNEPIKPVSAGTVIYASLNFIQINHTNGWSSTYYHVKNIGVSVNQQISINTTLGYPSCETGRGGAASGSHVHFGLRFNNIHQPIDGKILNGWTIYEGASQYNGTMVKSGTTRTANARKPENSAILYSVLDTSDPIVTTNQSGTAGSNNWYISDVQFTCSATDADSGIKNIATKIGSAAWQNHFTSSKTVSVSNEGTTELRCSATDNAASPNTAEAPVETVKIDKTAPSLTYSPTTNNWQTADASVSMTASDSTSGLASREYSLDSGSTWRPYNAPFTIATEGSNPISFRATDNAGHQTTKHTVIHLDKTAPQLTGASINNDSVETNQVNVNLTLNTQDPISGLDAIRISNDNSTWSEWLPYLSNIAWSIPAENEQSHTIYVQVRDEAGWTSAVVSDSILLNLYPERPSSTSYRLCASYINAGGQVGATSTSYQLNSTIGDAVGGTNSQSNSYQLQTGYLAAVQGCQPQPSPIIGQIEITQEPSGGFRFIWSDPATSGICHYDLYQELFPYTTPVNQIATGQTAELTVSTPDLTHYFYQIHVSCTSGTAVSSQIGVFNFSLSPGAP